MPQSSDPNVWELVFNQTPPVLRWTLGVLTLGLFTLAGTLYRWHRADMAAMHRRLDRMEMIANERHQQYVDLLFRAARTDSRSQT